MPERSPVDVDDAGLLAELGAALAPADLRPPEATRAALHAAVAQRTTVARRTSAGAPVRRIAVWAHHRWAVAAGAVAVLTLGTGTAFAAGVPVPPPLRVLATDVGLPVTPQPVIDVRNATTSLQRQLQATPPDPAGTAAAAGHLAGLIHAMPASQQASVPAVAPQLLHQACRQVFPSATDRAASSPRTLPSGWAGCPRPSDGAAPSPPSSSPPPPSTTSSSTTPPSSRPTPTTDVSAPGHPDGGNGRPGSAPTGQPTSSGPGRSPGSGPTTPTTWPARGSGGVGSGTGTGTVASPGGPATRSTGTDGTGDPWRMPAGGNRSQPAAPTPYGGRAPVGGPADTATHGQEWQAGTDQGR